MGEELADQVVPTVATRISKEVAGAAFQGEVVFNPPSAGLIPEVVPAHIKLVVPNNHHPQAVLLVAVAEGERTQETVEEGQEVDECTTHK